MKKELDEQLCSKYPKIFVDRHGNMMETAMCWGFDIGDGWYNIIDQLCFEIQSHLDWKNDKSRNYVPVYRWYNIIGHLRNFLNRFKKRQQIAQVVATQVKEKFGTLRFYYAGGDDVVDGMLRMAEAMSSVTCEECGNPGKVEGMGWLKARCASCKC
jgi:hypothetical protein